MLVKKIFSVLFLVVVLGTMAIIYSFGFLENRLVLPNIYCLLSVVIPLILVCLALWSVFSSFGIGLKVRKTVMVACSLILLIPCIYFGVTMFNNHLNSFFNTERWISNPNERTYIVDNLLYKYNLKGMNKGEVRDLLGEPTNTVYFKTPDNYVYCLGPERGLLRIDSEWLVIEFDKSDKVISYSIARD